MIPLDASEQIFRGGPEATSKLQAAHGGHHQQLARGGVSASIGDRPVPPPSAMRLMALQRQEEREEQRQMAEASELEKTCGMAVAEDCTSHNLVPDASVEAIRARRQLAQVNLDTKLCNLACKYEVHGCALDEVNGLYEYSTASCHGAPVYTNGEGWNLHRDRPPVESTIGTDDIRIEFGWVISKDRKPWYGVRTNDLIALSRGWQSFNGPLPAPSYVTHTSWETHFLEVCSPLKDAGNLAIQQGNLEQARLNYSRGISRMDGYDAVVASSEKLLRLQIALYANRAEVSVRLKQWPDALRDSRWVLDSDPVHIKAALRLAKACKALRKWDDAISVLERFLQSAGPEGNAEVRLLLTEAEVLRKCEHGDSKLSIIFRLIEKIQDLAEKYKEGICDNHGELCSLAANLRSTLSSFLTDIAGDAEGRRDVNVILKSTGFLDIILWATSDEEASKWSISLLEVCIWQYTREEDVKKVLDGLQAMVPHLVANPQSSLTLVLKLLQNRFRQHLKIADRLVETPGLLVGCLSRWAVIADDFKGDSAEMAVADAFHELQAQSSKPENVKALSLAFFVECFIGSKSAEKKGGFVLYHGSAIRHMVLSTLRLWIENKVALATLSPSLVGRAWNSVKEKIHRDSSIDVEKALGKPGADAEDPRKIFWFRLKPLGNLRKDIGAFFVEELLEAFLDFLRAHFLATCERGCETLVQDGISARHPAEEWVEEVLDKPFAWGLLLPLVIAPPAIGSRTASLLEQLIEKHPNNEFLAKQLARYQVFMPLLGMPWPPTKAAQSHLETTMGLGSVVRRSLMVLLRCTIDTEMAMKVARMQLDMAFIAVVDLLSKVIKDRDQPDAISSVLETLGIIATNMDCWDKLSSDTILDLVREFIANCHKPTRNHFAKVLRHIHSNKDTSEKLSNALSDDRLQLNDVQQNQIMAEIFDTSTLAGRMKAQRMIEIQEQIETTPSDMTNETSHRKHVDALVDAIYGELLNGKMNPRVLVMGRIARPFARRLASKNCRVVLGDTSVDRGNADLEGVDLVLLPRPQALESDIIVASQEKFDLVITAEPSGYYDGGEYADKMRPFIKRREEEEERLKDQVQWVCVELQERCEDARDDMYSAGYYSADHVKCSEIFRSLARKWQHDVILLSLPSNEKEKRKNRDHIKATERMAKREQDQQLQQQREDDAEQRRGVLYETLFDPLLTAPEISALPVAFELGAEAKEADLVFFWLHANGEEPQCHEKMLQTLVDSFDELKIRVVAPTFPEGRSEWFSWSDEVAVSMGMEWYEMADDPTAEAYEKAKKEPVQNASFHKPILEELQCVEEIEGCCKQLLNLAEEEVIAGLRPGAVIVFGGFSQGGSIACYAALSELVPAELKPYLQGVVPCCSGVPVFHFLGAKMQAQALKNRAEEIYEQIVKVQMIYSQEDPEINEKFVNTMKSLCKRFDFKTALLRLRGSLEKSRFPEDLRQEVLSKALQNLLLAN